MSNIDSLLARWIKKKQISSYYEMNEEEKASYTRFEQVLKGKPITDNDVKAFFETEINEITEKLCSPDLTDKQDWFLKVELRLLKKIKDFLDTPENNARNAKIALEQQLEN